MAAFRYKAFISYSHADESWARWLHRALETFPVPRHLRGRDSPVGPVPRRLAPVFRDRDELSLSDSLGRDLEEALAASATLIVLCSPAAAASRWTDEEVRRFQALGRADRIFCVLVDGDPEREPCFPPSIHDEASDTEPLFADPRESGDGKTLARQKIIAALLGVPLDEVRQRDRVRRRRWTIGFAAAAVILLGLTLQTLLSRQAEQRERERAEQLAMFVVDIGDRLQDDVDLETRRLIAGQAMSQLAGIDQARLPPETRLKVGLALRQIGRVHEGQGEPEDALSAFTESRDIFADLARRNPQDDTYLYELSQAEFFIGEFHRVRGEYEAAEAPVRSYEAIARQLYEADPTDADRLLELSYSTGNILSLQLTAGQRVDAAILERADESVRLARASLEAGGENSELLNHLSMTLAWAADAQLYACRLDQALDLRDQNLAYAEATLDRSPTSQLYQWDLALAHSGVATVNHAAGNLQKARQHREENVRRLRALLAGDPSYFQLESQVVYREVLLGKLLWELGEVGRAKEIFDRTDAWYREQVAADRLSAVEYQDYTDYLLSRAELEYRAGSSESARSLLAQAAGHFKATPALLADDSRTERLFRRARWLAQISGVVDEALAPSLSNPAPQERPQGPYRDCQDADHYAREALIEGRQAEAEEQVAFLLERGYRYPDFLHFCRSRGLCAPDD